MVVMLAKSLSTENKNETRLARLPEFFTRLFQLLLLWLRLAFYDFVDIGEVLFLKLVGIAVEPIVNHISYGNEAFEFDIFRIGVYRINPAAVAHNRLCCFQV